LRGKRYSGPPPPPSLNVERPGGVQNLIWVVDLDARFWAVQICMIFILNSGPPPPPPPSLNSGRWGGSRINLVRWFNLQYGGWGARV
jgi:hypothetical protein